MPAREPCKERPKTSWSSHNLRPLPARSDALPDAPGGGASSVIVPNALAPSARMRSPISHSSPLLQFLPATIPRAARQDLAIRCACALSIGLAGKTLPSRVSASGQGSVRGRERTTGRFLSLRGLWRHTDSDPLPVEGAFCPRARVPRRRGRTYPLLPGGH